VIGAVLVTGREGAQARHARAHRAKMEPGSVVVDVAVDQGGCIETCRPTTHDNPTYEVDGVVHYCVANMPGAVAHTSTWALTNTTIGRGTRSRARQPRASWQPPRPTEACSSGLNTFGGQITYKGVADAHGLEYVAIEKALG
jgi:alanine dehydrogenase